MQTKSNLRAQSRGDSGFARVFTIMAMLLLMSTGAWAQEWISGITNGDFSGDDVSSFCKKVYPSTDVVPVVIGANVGKNGTPGIVVTSGDDTANPDAQNYDTQFWIVLPEEIPAGSSIRVQFDYKASKAVKASTELHADPKSYLTWNAIGDVNFTTEWQTFNREFTVPNDGDGMKSIAFDLQWEKSATDYYFDNFSVSYKKSEWTNIIVNSDMEGTDVSCYYVKDNALGSDNIYLAHITDGIGKDDSRAIRVRSTGNEENTWDTQFFIRLPYELPASTKYRLSFDHKAGKNIKSDFQCANEPKEYIIWYIGENDTDDFSFTTEWQHYKRVYNVPSVCNGEKNKDADWLNNFQTIYFSLAMDAPDGEATEYIIDNVKVEILNSVLPTLTPSPVTDPKLMVAYPPYTVSLAEGTVDADKWTITPAEGAYEGETVTATYSGTKRVKSVTAVVKSAEPATVDLDASTKAWADGSAFAVPAGGLTYSDAVTVSGNVTLTLTAGTTLTLNKGISLASGATLTIDGTGTMVVNGTNESTASTVAGSTGTLVLTSGTLTAKGGNGASTPGGQDNNTGADGGVAINGAVTVAGGALTATGGNGGNAGEYADNNKGGAGAAAISGDVTMTSGTIAATGGNGGNVGEYSDNDKGGAGGSAIAGNATLTGGTLTRTDGSNGSVGGHSSSFTVGAGGKAVAGTVTNNGGTVN